MSSKKRRLVLGAIYFSFFCFFLTSCSSYNAQTKKFYDYYKVGRTEDAAIEVTILAEKSDEKDKLLYRLEEGTIKLAASQFEESLIAFNLAEEIIQEKDDSAKLTARKIADEIQAVAVNATVLTYHGTAYDKIMLNSYKSLAYLRNGNITAAKIELRRAYSRQKEAVEKYAKDIEKSKKDGSDKHIDIESDKYKEKLSAQYANLEDYSAYAVYVNPFTVYLDGLLNLASYEDASDLERAKKNFERVGSMLGSPASLKTEIALVEKFYKNEKTEPLVFIIVEHGLAPHLVESKMDLFIPVNAQLEGVLLSGALPTMEFNISPYASLSANGQKIKLLSNMDAVIATEFKKHLPIRLTRMLISMAVKAIAQHNADKRGKGALYLGSILYTALTNRADLRIWRTLPKEFLFATMPIPKDGKIEFKSKDGSILETIELESENQLTLLYLKIPSRGSISKQIIKLR
ncbi:MAG: hypothetical protein HRT89_04650 [Lentisphaeria bacterium]|nr:hypothetical protein [Lentisphaeria bacterium]NQZ67337.1 hypothetical protein [Lentisphaeria bacterium]